MKQKEPDEVFPEITMECDGKKVRSVDYGWEDDTFVVVEEAKPQIKEGIFKLFQ
jgi:hypothetical protein